MSEKRNTLSTAITKKIGGIAKLSHLAAAGQETVNKRRGEVTEFVMTLAREVWQRYDINEDKDKAKIQVFNVLRDACEHIADKDLKARQRKEPQYGIEQGDELPIGNLLSAWQMVCHGISLGVDPTEQDKDEEFIAYTNYRKATELAKEQAKFDALDPEGQELASAQEEFEQVLRQLQKAAGSLDIEGLIAARNVLDSAHIAMESYDKKPSKLRNLLEQAAQKAA